MALDRYDVLIVGGGHGGAATAATLRQHGYVGTVGLVGEEPDPPYERPALSKEYLAGDRSFERMVIRPDRFWADRRVDLLLGRRVEAVDPAGRRVVLADGTALGYGQLVWATGGTPRRLTCSGHDLPGVHAVRTRADVDRLRAELATTSHVAVVGGGYIGLEAAAVLTGFGKRVTVLEAQDRVLARVAGEALSRFYELEHRARGVDVRLGAAVACVEEAGGRPTGVRLADGEVVACQMVVVGIGIVPAVEPLLAVGAVGGNGVAVDRLCRTSLPGVYAIGDCALHPNPYAGGAAIRLESVQNANDQAGVVARAIAGDPRPYEVVPWFWSNQYDLRLQTVGLSAGHDETVLRGNPARRSFSVIYRKSGEVVALDCVNATKDYVQGRALVQERSRISVRKLADADVAIKEILAECRG